MKESTLPATSQTKSTDHPTGVVPGVVHLALDVADRGQSTVIAVLQETRIELRTAIDGGLEFAEKLATGALRLSRKIVQKIDDASASALGGAERVLTNAVKNARETSRAAGELAATAASGVAGSQAA